ncbi:MAG: HNH endonuclease [Candidatus Omnitrophica bacterium]|nr:HNH endonuclease [Candidatus Omnitrophota bacterium]
MTHKQLKIIFAKTDGHCHFCGDPLSFDKYGCKNVDNLKGSWEADHVIQKGKGGSKIAKNCLPACVRCNRLRWHRKGKDLRELLLLGIISKKEIKRKSSVGKQILKLKTKWIEANKKRRR